VVDELTTARAALVETCHRAAALGLVSGTSGNLSARVGELVAITATGCVLGEATIEHVVVVDRSGRLRDGHLEPTSELGLHLAVYDSSDAGAVVHTHAPVSTALSTALEEMPCIHYQQLALGGTIRVAPYATFGTEALAEGVAAALEGRSAALMANHGSVAVGATPAGAFDNARLLEWLCTVYRDASIVGTPRALSADEQADVVRAVIERDYGVTRPASPDHEGDT